MTITGGDPYRVDSEDTGEVSEEQIRSHNLETQKKLSYNSLARIYGDAQGNLDALDKLLMKYDVDCSGDFTITEVKAIVRDLDNQKQMNKQLMKIIIGGGMVFVAMCGLLVALMLAANEVSKESHVTGTVMTSTDGAAVETAPVESFVDDIRGFLSLEFSTLAKITFVQFNTNCGGPTLTEHFFTVSRFERIGDTALTLFGHQGGDKITITSLSATLFTSSSSTEICLGSRRALQWSRASPWSTSSRLLSSFGGALMTSGSFTMMASAGIGRRV